MHVGLRRSTDCDDDDGDGDDNDVGPKMKVIIPYSHFQTSQQQNFVFLPSSFFYCTAKHRKMNIYDSKLLTAGKQYLILLVSSNFLH
jgi:hypothetical protein